jgi:2-polyprenyl-3-methyl-5-hydroxy-6-metoxy-1,4-benzoquinol methylase
VTVSKTLLESRSKDLNCFSLGDCATRSIHGMAYNIITNSWHWTSNVSINYALHAVKMGSEKNENAEKN